MTEDKQQKDQKTVRRSGGMGNLHYAYNLASELRLLML